jgi:hypothetical protein
MLWRAACMAPMLTRLMPTPMSHFPPIFAAGGYCTGGSCTLAAPTLKRYFGALLPLRPRRGRSTPPQMYVRIQEPPFAWCALVQTRARFMRGSSAHHTVKPTLRGPKSGFISSYPDF